MLTIQAGSNYTFQGIILSGATSGGVGINLQGSGKSFVVSGNVLNGPSSGTTDGVLTSGSIDYYDLVNNVCAATWTSCTNDTASGTHKTISGNE